MNTSALDMKPFLDDNFLLENSVAEELYHQYAKDLPIIDYHCHLPPDQIASNHQFDNLTQIWLNGDHYKWRAMRTNGVPEQFITGEADDLSKFVKWAQTVPYTMRNPLYHWTHLELRNYFGINEVLNGNNAEAVYRYCSALLQQQDYRVQPLLSKMNVEIVCSTDDPIDNLEHHIALAKGSQDVSVFPAFRPDKAIFIEKGPDFVAYIQRLGEVAGVEIKRFKDLLEALNRRADFFHQNGCRLSDHGLEQLYAADYTEKETDEVFRRALAGQYIEPEKALVFKSAILHKLGQMYHARGWTQQFHLGAYRNANSRMKRVLGPDTGFDSIGDYDQINALGKYLDRLDNTDQLAKTILYNLNPRDNEAFATMIGNFNDGSVAGKMQFGSGWWFLDQKDGMEKQINTLSNMGLLSRFVGMLTDSRSFLSYPRHEYFRRILCNLFGRDVVNGELPHDVPLIGQIVSDICYFNAKNYFKFPE